ncbi:MAG: glycine dehydrogenase, partial [Phenylobacterium sp.]|nr:glycine dehydrogenase [Phenylobacterium sp.]
NSGLCALAFTIHLSLLGERGLRDLAALNHSKARELREALAAVKGVEVLTPRFFNEFAIRVPGDAAALVESLLDDGIVAGVPFSRLNPGAGMDDVLLVAATETTMTSDIQAFAQALARRIGQ